MNRADRLPFALGAAFFAAGDFNRAGLALINGEPLTAIVPMLAAVGWTSLAYYLWRRRTMRVTFDDDQWAEIHSAKEMPRRVTVRMQDMLAETPADQTGYQALQAVGRMRDTLMAMVVTAWSYGDAPGGDVEVIYDLPQAAYDKLKEETSEHWTTAGFLDAEKEQETSPARKKTRAPSSSSA